MNQFSTFTVYFVVFLDMLGFGVIIPAIRDVSVALVQNSGLSYPPEVLMGVLMAAYSGAQMLSAPILGRLSDTFGRKPIFLVSAAGNLVGYVVWLKATTYWPFLAGRIISGITGGNIAIAQSILADHTPPEARPRAMGLLGACIGMGFVLGPFIGSISIKFNHIVLTNFNPYWYVGVVPLVLSFISVVMIIFAHFGAGRIPAGAAKFALLSRSSLAPVYATQLLAQLSFVSFEVLFAWILQHQYGFGLEETFLIFGLQGFVLALVQGGLYRWLEKRLPPQAWVLWGLWLSAVATLLLPWIGKLRLGQIFGIPIKVWLLSADLLLLALALGFGSPSLQAYASLKAPATMQGQVMGSLQGLAAFARFSAPLLATTFYALWLPLPFLVAASFCAAGGYIFQRSLRNNGDGNPSV
ncbi:MAG: MFS transporter [Turneriella sp.]|nr:MFS transporter [Turneriella sp.]